MIRVNESSVMTVMTPDETVQYAIISAVQISLALLEKDSRFFSDSHSGFLLERNGVNSEVFILNLNKVLEDKKVVECTANPILMPLAIEQYLRYSDNQ